MRGWRPGLDRSFLESRVARRVFAVVAACALLPVATFAGFSYLQVQGQLERDADGALDAAAKSSAMAIVQRLLLAEEALRLQTEATAATADPGVDAARMRLLLWSGQVDANDPRIAELTAAARARLSQGRPVLQLAPSADAPRISLLRGTPDSAETSVAEIDPRFAFAGAMPSGGRAWVTGPDGQLLFVSPVGWRPPEARLARLPGVSIAGEPSLVVRREVFLAGYFGARSWTVWLSRPLVDVHRPLREFEAVFPWVAGLTLCGALLLSLRQIRRVLVPVAELTAGARRVAVGDFAVHIETATRDEFGYLAEAFNEMAEVIGRQIEVLATVNKIGAALSAEKDNERLADLIVRGAMAVTGATATALFLVEDDQVDLCRLRTASRRAVIGTSPETALPLAPVLRCHEERTVQAVDDLSEVDEDERAAWDAFGLHLGERVVGYLGLPLCNDGGEVLGVLLLLRCGLGRFTTDETALAESLASQAAVAIHKNGLVASFRGLFEGLIQLTVKAIDEKSAHTGDHCRNVPILSEMIADAVCADQRGPLKDVSLSDEERYELRIAALLHDCGKVVTPVHVIDKSTKLETIGDRIELVETRFEVLRRDARLRALARQLARLGEGGDALGEDPALAEELRTLDEDLDFLRRTNRGVERMSEADMQRIRRIARAHRWETRHGVDRDVLDDIEVTNLTIVRGTLNAEEHKIIRNHVVLTMSMLEELPFPRNLRNVPAIAGAHHERIDGTGYPLGLRGEQLSLQGRILGLADVFEALTAKDRPYKEGKTLRETLDILEAMSEEGHIDPQLYELFLRENLHLRYAAAHLSPEQIDPEFHGELEALTGP